MTAAYRKKTTNRPRRNPTALAFPVEARRRQTAPSKPRRVAGVIVAGGEGMSSADYMRMLLGIDKYQPLDKTPPRPKFKYMVALPTHDGVALKCDVEANTASEARALAKVKFKLSKLPWYTRTELRGFA